MWPFKSSKPKVSVGGLPVDMAHEAKALVERARCGDQNAMAMIVMVKKNADKGLDKAKLTKGLIEHYINANPVVGADKVEKPLPPVLLKQMRAEDKLAECILRACRHDNGFLAASLILSYLGPINRNRVEQYGLASFGSDAATSSFYWGVHNPEEEKWLALHGKLPSEALNTMRVGQCFGRAWRLQRVRMKKSRISDFSPKVGWELGE